MKSIKNVLIIVGLASVLLCGRDGYAVPTDILKYAFDSDTNNPTSKAEKITASPFDSSLKRNRVFVNGNPGKAFEDDGWSSLGNYYYFSLSVTQGYKVSLAGLSFDQKKTPSGVKNWELLYRIGESGSFASAATGSADYTNWTKASADLSGKTDLQNVVSTIYLRLKAAGASNESKKWDIDNMLLTGEVSVVPEPATISLLGIGALCLIRKKNINLISKLRNFKGCR